VSNTGVTSLVAGTNVSVSGATGAVTVNAPAFGTTITASTIGGTAAAGTSTTIAREDHKHAFPSGAAPSALTVSSTQATGTSTSPALADHVHAMPGSATAGASAVGDTAAAGTATTVALSDHRHSREAFGTPGAVTGGATAASGSATTLARSDHVHSTASMPVLLASTTLSSAAASVTFYSISTSYLSLMITYGSRTAYTTGSYESLRWQMNDDTASNYVNFSGSGTYMEDMGGSATASAFGGSQISSGQFVINNANNTSTWKLVTGICNVPTSTTSYAFGYLIGGSGWRSTAAITKIKVFASSGSNITSGSTFAVYGLP
jgi:hypothetical protein